MSTIVWIYATSDKKPPGSIVASIALAKRNIIGASNFVVIGDRPPINDPDVEWVEQPKLTVDEYQRISGTNRKWAMRQRDVLFKMLRAIQLPQVSDTFIRMYDDHFILKPMSIDAFMVPMRWGSQEVKPTGQEDKNGFKEIKRRTFLRLRDNGFTSYDFSYHPIVAFNKDKFQQTVERFNVVEKIALPETLYCNQWYKPHQMGRYTSKLMRNLACINDWPADGEEMPHYVCVYNKAASQVFPKIQSFLTELV